jgi:phospholipid-binding lipoprotein MlaA
MSLRVFSLFLPAVLVLTIMSGCGPKVVDVTDPQAGLEPTGFQTQVHHWPEENSNSWVFLEVDDPWEPMNRNLYEINATLDKYVMLPAATLYKVFIPSVVRSGVKNFIANLNEMPVAFNSVLQGRMEKAAISFSRFLINSTFGLLGVRDLASRNKKLPRQSEDFGQTLGYWGIGSGPYFVMPILGPSNVRDAAGFGGDILILYAEMTMIYQATGIENNRPLDMTDLIIRGINLRANTAFSYHSTGSPFEYEMVRFIYTKKRELDIQR